MKMEKNYPFLEAFAEIDGNYLEQAMQPWSGDTDTAAKGRFHVFTKSFLAKAACFVLVAALGMAAIFHGQVKTVLANMTSDIAEILGITNDLTPYTEIINQTQTKDGISVTLKEVLLSGDMLIAAFEAQASADADAVTGMGSSLELTVGGETIDCNSGSVVSDDGLDSENEDSQEYVMTWEAEVLTVGDGNVELNLEITAHQGEDDQEGTPFTFAFTASAEDLMDETLYMFPEQKIQAEEDVELEVYNVTWNRVMGEICAGTTGTELSLTEYQYYFEAQDNLGNQAEYSLSNLSAAEYTDENGETVVFYTFRNVGNPLSMESEWIEFQLYRIPWVEFTESAGAPAGDGTDGTQTQIIGGTDGATSMFVAGKLDGENETETENTSGDDDYGTKASFADSTQAIPVGEAFRVKPSEASTSRADVFYYADGNTSTARIITDNVAEAAADDSSLVFEEGDWDVVEESGCPDTPQAGDVYWEKIQGESTGYYYYVCATSETGSYMTEKLTNGETKSDGEVGDVVEIGGIRCKVTVSGDSKVMTAHEIQE